MIRAMISILRRFRKEEDGSPSVEFVLMFMPIMLLVVSAFELGLLMTRHVMLERGLDMAIREVRLNTGSDLDETELKQMICNGTAIIPNCTTQLRLEMRPIDLRNWSNIPNDASCTDVADPFKPSRNFSNGSANQMMIVRACGVFTPMLPNLGLGYLLAKGDHGHYRLVSMSAFVMEPV